MLLPPLLAPLPPTVPMHALDTIGSTLALWQGPIQATRDATQALYADLKIPVITIAVAAALYGGIIAFQGGADLRTRALSAASAERSVGSQELLLLVICLTIDLGGVSSYLLPGIGEAADLLWAPASAFLVRAVFESNILALANFAKEALPFTDILPLATLAWVLYFVYPDSEAARALGLGPADRPEK